MSVAELVCRSNYSLLEGASHPEELVEHAASLGLAHLALTDRDGVYGQAEAWRRGRDVGLHVVHGSRVTVAGQPSVTLLVETLEGWSNLCRLLTLGRSRAPKGRSEVEVAHLAERAAGLTAVLHAGWTAEGAGPLAEAFGDHLEIAVSRRLSPADRARERLARSLAEAFDRPLLATNDVLYHEASRQRLQHVVTCIRRRTTLEAAGRSLAESGERHLLSPEAFVERYGDLPGAVERGRVVAERCTFTLQEVRYRYPREVVPEGHTPMSWLRELVRQGAARRWSDGVPDTVRAQLEHELGIIERLDFPSYFLTVHDVVRFAREVGILCQGRGSAANSAVCFAIGITEVDPARSSLLFERFISEERGEPPDIDVDFEHERREEVIQYIYERYGRHRAGMVNEVIAYRGRSAIRDVGKVFGLSLDRVDRLARSMDRWSAGDGADPAELVREAGVDPSDPVIRQTLAWSAAMKGFPRHLSIHVGGFAIAADSLVDMVPVEPASMADRTVIQWDKYAVDDVGFVKVDVLGLGMLTCIRRAFDLVAAHHGRQLTLATVPAEDTAVYEMFGRADTIGVFQIESRAQMSMLPRLKPSCFYDLVIEVAIVRPGPIQGGMVHPYLRRRNEEEEITFAHPALIPILKRTCGVPLFQEQVMAMAVAVGGFTNGEADALRRAMGAWRKRGGLDAMGEKLVRGMMANGIEESYARAIFQQILGFGEYGFPESHAASFALLVYVSGWLKCHYPAAFAAALVNSQPMGFYSPRAILDDARRHGVPLRAVCVLASAWECTLEPEGEGVAIRLGLRLVRGLAEDEATALVKAREDRPFRDIPDLAWRTGLSRRALGLLADAGALAPLVPERRTAAWVIQGLWTELPLFAGLQRREPDPELPPESEVDALRADYRALGLSLEAHPAELARRALVARGMALSPLTDVLQLETGSRVQVMGLVSTRQRPGTASGVVFMTFEDESGLLNLVVWPKVWARDRTIARRAVLLGCEGVLQRDAEAVSVLVERFWTVDEAPDVRAPSRDFH